MTIFNLINYHLFTLKNKKYLKLIDKVVLNIKDIKIVYLDKFISSGYSNELFKINNNGTIDFLHHQNLIKFCFNKKELNNSTKILVNINIKNQQSYELIQTIIKLQYKFIRSNNKQDLIYLSHKEILSFHKKYYSTSLVSSNISTIINNSFYKDRYNNIFKLSYLLPKQHYILYLKIRYILNYDRFLTDKDISLYLKDSFDIDISKLRVYQLRKRYLIPSKKYRDQNIYLQYSKKYSKYYILNFYNISLFKDTTAVYELLCNNIYKYNFTNTHTVYIGSTNNIKNRLLKYLYGFAHTQKLKDFIQRNKIYFRIIKTDIYKELEKDILDAFNTTYGEYPLLNCNRVL